MLFFHLRIHSFPTCTDADNNGTGRGASSPREPFRAQEAIVIRGRLLNRSRFQGHFRGDEEDRRGRVGARGCASDVQRRMHDKQYCAYVQADEFEGSATALPPKSAKTKEQIALARYKKVSHRVKYACKTIVFQQNMYVRSCTTWKLTNRLLGVASGVSGTTFKAKL